MSDLSEERLKLDWRKMDLLVEMLESDAYRLERRILQFNLSLEVFHRNFHDLNNAIGGHLPTPSDPRGLKRFFQNAELRDEQQIEITRLLHNFVAAASTLIDTTRVFYREEYESKGLMTEYQSTMESYFPKNGVPQVVVGLRQLAQHIESPLISSSVNWKEGDSQWGAEVILECASLLRHGCWKPAAKEHLEKQGKSINVRTLIISYHQQVTEFYNWFSSRQQEIHKDEFAYLRGIREQVEQLRAQIKEIDRKQNPAQSEAELEPDHNYSPREIELLAYYMYLDEGRKPGRDQEHWYRAIQRLRELEERAPCRRKSGD